MTRNAHDEARELIVLGDALSDAQQISLRKHLEGCADCLGYQEAMGNVVRALRSEPIAADSRVREARERMWVVGMACVGVGISTALTAPLLWRLFAWMGEQVGVSTFVWQAGFAVFCITPAVVASVLLLARGTHLSHGEEKH